MHQLLTYWNGEVQLLPSLIAAIDACNDAALRHSNIRIIARTWKSDPSVLSWLKGMALSDPNVQIRQRAVQELAHLCPSDAGMLDWLKARVKGDDDSVVGVAFEGITRGWKDSPDALSWLRDLAESDPRNDIRRRASRQLEGARPD